MHLFLAAASILFVVTIAPAAAHAIPAITCHCFTDRSYDPARPAAADPYFLATAQNSFLSQVYGVEKRTIVMKKQRGTPSDDLWMAYEVAQHAGVAADALLETQQAKKSWKDTLASHRVDPRKLPKRLWTAIETGTGAGRLADTVVDDLFLRYRIYGEADLGAMRKAGGTNQEILFAALLSMKSGKPAMQHLAVTKSGEATWGGMMQKEKLELKEMEREISQLLKGRRR